MARFCSTWAAAEAARARIACTCCGAVCADRSSASDCCARTRVVARRLSAALIACSASPHLRPCRVRRRVRRVCGRHRGVELLLRDFVLGEQPLQPLDVARRLDRAGFQLAHPRLRGGHAGRRPGHGVLGLGDLRLRSAPTPL